MLTIGSKGRSQDCEGHSRRDFLRIGALGLGGLTLADLLALRARAAAEGSGFARNKSVVFLFLHGGPTQYETWDPKMDAPDGIRSMHGEVQTQLPGVTFGSSFSKLGAMASKLAVVRSFRVGTGSHGTGRQLITNGNNPTQATMGSVYASLTGSTNPVTGMPNNILLPPRSAGAQFANLDNRVEEVQMTGRLSPEFRAFDPSAGSAAALNSTNRRNQTAAPRNGLLADMQLQVPAARLDDRRALLQQLSGLQTNLERTGAIEDLDRYRQQAFNVITRGVRDAFDLTREDPRTIARYDTAHCRIPEQSLRKGTNNAGRIPEFAPYALGKQMLLARRLCEAGCGFVTVTNHGWDMHGNAFGIDDGIPCLGPALDHAVSTFLEDLQHRGLSDQVLLVVTGEMGRTPRINNRAGRDHWANICSLLLAGGGLRMGQVIGASDRQGGAPATTPYTVENLLATVMHTLFDIGQLRVARGVPAELLRALTTTEPIRELFS